MKNISLLLTGLLLTMSFGAAFSQSRSGNPENVSTVTSVNKAVKVSSSPGLYQLAQIWADEYNKSCPSAGIALERLADDNTFSMDHLSFVTEQNSMAVSDQPKWKMLIGRDVIVPVVNAKNPMLDLLGREGVSPGKFAQLFRDPSSRNWSAIVSGAQNVPMQFYVPDNKVIIAGLTNFARIQENGSFGKLTGNADDVFAAVQKDVFAIGFCTLNALKTYNQKSGKEAIRLLPIDKNGNGRMDTFENIYRNTDEFAHGVWIGKYPGALCTSIYAISPSKPVSENELAFLAWIIAEGQSKLAANGYCELASNEKQSNAASLISTANLEVQPLTTASSPKTWPVMLAILVLAGLFASLCYYSRRNAKSSSQAKEIQVAPFLVEHAMDVPKGLYFDKTHTWAFMEQDGNVRIGVDDFLQHITGKLTKIKMKEPGDKVRKGEPVMTIIRDGKQLNLYSPVTGTILEQNESLVADTSAINTSPFFKGWVYQIEPKNWLRETQFMLMGDKYAEWLRDEFTRLKDFIAASVRKDNLVYEHVILQDGGELTDNVLADMGPEIWEDFQTQFIDTSR